LYTVRKKQDEKMQMYSLYDEKIKEKGAKQEKMMMGRRVLGECEQAREREDERKGGKLYLVLEYTEEKRTEYKIKHPRQGYMARIYKKVSYYKFFIRSVYVRYSIKMFAKRKGGKTENAGGSEKITTNSSLVYFLILLQVYVGRVYNIKSIC
jgi:hypothetical protein